MQLCEFIQNNCFIDGFGMSKKLRNAVSYILLSQSVMVKMKYSLSFPENTIYISIAGNI